VGGESEEERGTERQQQAVQHSECGSASHQSSWMRQFGLLQILWAKIAASEGEKLPRLSMCLQ
jgi:hypothetical protein